MRAGRAPESHRPTVPGWLLLATVLSVPAWLLLTRWIQEDVSGWSELAKRYAAADGFHFEGSVGTAVVSFQEDGGLRYEFNRRRSASSPYIEVGYTEAGFWLRSREASPGPPLFVPWRDVVACTPLSASLAPAAHGGASVRIIVQEPGFERACAGATWRQPR